MIGFYPGSFDPVTRGHLNIIARALAFCPELVIAVGHNARKQDMFSVAERIALLDRAVTDALTADQRARVTIISYQGATVDEMKRRGATLIVKGLREFADHAFEERMHIVNRRLDPGIDTVFLMTDNDLRDVSSSAVREMARLNLPPAAFDHYVTPAVRDALLAKIGK